MLKSALASRRKHLAAAFISVFVLALAASAPLHALAQDKEEYEARRRRAFEFIDASKFAEARQIFEELAMEKPTDGPVMFGLGFSTMATAKNIKDPDERRKARLRARKALLRAKELGVENELLDAIIAAIPPDGGEETPFSDNAEADRAMEEGEAAFTRGDFDAAITAYSRAYKLDPKLYEAALFIGDMYFRKKDADRAGEWFTRAISIDPNRETAYRYWGNALMAAERTDEARNKYIEAIIAAPYSRMTWENGLIRWANDMDVRLSHPKIDVPTDVSSSKNGEVNITIDPSLFGNKEDGSTAWIMYSITRANWRKEKFAKTFPKEKTYRHSLMEEAEALRLVAATAKADKKAKKLSPSLSSLVQLTDAGLLEAYILLGRPDDGIVNDYEEYRKTNRDKLRQYLLEYVVGVKKNQGKF